MTTKIYVVEDHELVRESLVEFISAAGDYQVLCYSEDAEEALQKLPELQVDLALIDVSLPGQSGIDLVHRLRDICPHLNCLMLSGHRERS